MDLGLAGRAYIITGGSAGIGKATAEILVEEGASVLLSARGAGRLNDVVDALTAKGGTVVGHAADAVDPATPEALKDAALKAFGRIDGIIAAAGGSDGAHLRDYTPESWADTFAQNTLSAVGLAHACIPTMKEAGWGRIVTIASTAGRTSDPRFAAYAASKAALMSATRVISRSYSKYNILANAVLPGLTRSESILAGYDSAAQRMGKSPDEIEQRMMELEPISMGRTGTPDEVARMVVFLASNATTWTTGVNIQVDGGTIRDLP
ncbi:MAG: SDR family oxidoreductase [Protaetiibacter sp.]